MEVKSTKGDTHLGGDDLDLILIEWLVEEFRKDQGTGEAHAIDPALYDVLNDLRLATGTKGPFQVISAYRAPRTNAM